MVTSPDPATINNELYGISGSGSDIWAVGLTSGNDDVYHPLTLHWNGSAWSAVPNADPGSTELDAVSGSGSDVWAAGGGPFGEGQTLTMHWDGSAWTVVPSPNVGTGFNNLSAISGNGNDVWAVGVSATVGGYNTLTLHWSNQCITTTPSLTPTPTTPATSTATSTPTRTNTGTAVPTHTNTPISTSLPTQTSSVATSTSTPTGTVTPTVLVGTPSATRTPVPAATGTAPVSPSPSATATASSSATAIAPSVTPTACSITFTDVPQGSTFYSYIHCLACLGIIGGYPDGTFRPNNNVTRGQLSKIVSNAAAFADAQPNRIFQDVPAGSTFQVYIGRLASRGYISGYPCGGPGEECLPPGNLPYFRPDENATRGQISKIVSDARGFTDPPGGQMFEDVPPGSTFYTYTERLASRSIISGYPCGGTSAPCIAPGNLPYFHPNNKATRGQTSKIVSNTFFPDCALQRR